VGDRPGDDPACEVKDHDPAGKKTIDTSADRVIRQQSVVFPSKNGNVDFRLHLSLREPKIGYSAGRPDFTEKGNVPSAALIAYTQMRNRISQSLKRSHKRCRNGRRRIRPVLASVVAVGESDCA